MFAACFSWSVNKILLLNGISSNGFPVSVCHHCLANSNLLGNVPSILLGLSYSLKNNSVCSSTPNCELYNAFANLLYDLLLLIISIIESNCSGKLPILIPLGTVRLYKFSFKLALVNCTNPYPLLSLFAALPTDGLKNSSFDILPELIAWVYALLSAILSLVHCIPKSLPDLIISCLNKSSILSGLIPDSACILPNIPYIALSAIPLDFK